MRIALISDVHFGPRAYYDGKLRKLSERAGELVRAFVAEMNEHERPDLVIHLGDAIEDQDRERDLACYQEFLTSFRDLKSEILYLAGNHDLINLSEDDLSLAWGGGYGLCHSQDRNGYHLVFLTARHRRSEGREWIELPSNQLEWLARDLSRPGLPTLIFMHHPLGEMDLRGNRWFEHETHLCLVANREQVRRVFEQSGRVLAVFCGHVHWNYLSVVAGIPYVTLQSLIENIDEDSPGRPACSTAVVDVESERILVRVLGEHPARYEFRLPGTSGSIPVEPWASAR